MNHNEYERELQCADGQHEFEELPVTAGGDFGILIGHSRCQRCGLLADELNVGPLMSVESRPVKGKEEKCNRLN